MGCRHPPPAPAKVTLTQAGIGQVTEGPIVGEPGNEYGVVGGAASLYHLTYDGSVVLLLIYGSSGSIPGSQSVDEACALEIHEAFLENGTKRDSGGPAVDWPAVFRELGIDPSRVCGGRVSAGAQPIGGADP